MCSSRATFDAPRSSVYFKSSFDADTTRHSAKPRLSVAVVVLPLPPLSPLSSLRRMARSAHAAPPAGVLAELASRGAVVPCEHAGAEFPAHFHGNVAGN